MRLLVQNFEGQVKTWFRGLPANSIPSYDDLKTSFLRQWGEKKYHLCYLTEFIALRKKKYKLFQNLSKDSIKFIVKSQPK
jgi:hypothetical protein